MAQRFNYSFTFTNAQPGSGVTFSARVFPDASSSVAIGPALVLDSSNSVSVWSDATILTAVTVDGNDNPLAATATSGSTSVTTGDGAAGHNPFAGGGSVPSTVVHSFDVEADPGGDNHTLVAGVNTGIVIPAGSIILPATAASSVFAVSLPADWDGTSPALGFGSTQAEAVANVTAGTPAALIFDLDGVENTPVAGFGTVIIPPPGDGATTATGSPWYCPDETTLWVALGVLGTGGDPGSTTGTAKLLVTYIPPAA